MKITRLIGFALYMTLGLLLGVMGHGLSSWQYWVVMGIAIGIDINSFIGEKK